MAVALGDVLTEILMMICYYEAVRSGELSSRLGIRLSGFSLVSLVDQSLARPPKQTCILRGSILNAKAASTYVSQLPLPKLPTPHSMSCSYVEPLKRITTLVGPRFASYLLYRLFSLFLSSFICKMGPGKSRK